ISCWGDTEAQSSVVFISNGNVIIGEGKSVTLDCAYASDGANPTLFWYIQYPNESPKYLLRWIGSGAPVNAPDFEGRFHASPNKTMKTIPLTVQNVQLSDSAVYYCALRPTVTITFSHPLQKHLRNSLTLYKNLTVSQQSIRFFNYQTVVQ
uniref:Ig-like domain-containing protein n=1 Tax=Paramormyrops kingsleyae TaxID=1676925 RepID=A0A3B3QBV1_9TELE